MTKKDYELVTQLQNKVKLLEEQNALLKDKIAKLEGEKKKLQKEVSDAGWEREAAHADDWRQVHEMGCC